MSDVSFHTSDIARTGSLLARYGAAEGPRDVMGFNIDGEILLFDMAAWPCPIDVLMIDRGAFWEESLQALVLDYVEQSEKYGCPAVADEAAARASAGLAEAIYLEAQRVAACG